MVFCIQNRGVLESMEHNAPKLAERQLIETTERGGKNESRCKKKSQVNQAVSIH